MITDIESRPPTNQLRETAEDFGRKVTEVANDVSNSASETCQTLSSKVGEGVQRTKEYAQHAVDATKDYAHQNPFPVALGTLISGFALGYLIGLMQRDEPSFRQRLFS